MAKNQAITVKCTFCECRVKAVINPSQNFYRMLARLLDTYPNKKEIS